MSNHIRCQANVCLLRAGSQHLAPPQPTLLCVMPAHVIDHWRLVQPSHCTPQQKAALAGNQQRISGQRDGWRGFSSRVVAAGNRDIQRTIWLARRAPLRSCAYPAAGLPTPSQPGLRQVPPQGQWATLPTTAGFPRCLPYEPWTLLTEDRANPGEPGSSEQEVCRVRHGKLDQTAGCHSSELWSVRAWSTHRGWAKRDKVWVGLAWGSRAPDNRKLRIFLLHRILVPLSLQAAPKWEAWE